MHAAQRDTQVLGHLRSGRKRGKSREAAGVDLPRQTGFPCGDQYHLLTEISASLGSSRIGCGAELVHYRNIEVPLHHILPEEYGAAEQALVFAPVAGWRVGEQHLRAGKMPFQNFAK